MKNTTTGEDYTTNEIQQEIQNEASEDMSNILAAQRQKERGFHYDN